MTEKKEHKHEKHHVPAAAHDETNELVQISRAEYDSLLQKIKELSSVQDQMKRTAADFENAKKRLQKEKEEFSQYVLEELLADLLPVLDNFERAFSHRTDAGSDAQKSVWSGLELVYKQLVEILKGRGLTRMEVRDKPFDPQFHEAVAKIEGKPEREGLIAEEMLAGYFLRGKVVRHAQVKVYGHSQSEEKIEELT